MTVFSQRPQNPPDTVGGLLQPTFRLFFSHFRTWMILTICIFVPFLILVAALNVNTASFTAKLLGHTTTPAEIRTIVASSLPMLALSGVLSLISAFVVVPLLYGSMLHGSVGVVESTDEDANVIQVTLTPTRTVSPVPQNATKPHAWNAFRHTLRRWPIVIGTVLMRDVLYCVAIIVAGAVIALVVMLFQAMGFNSTAVGTAAVILSLTALWVLVWLAMRFAFMPSATFEEGLSYMGALRRSVAMTQGRVLRMVWFFVIVGLIVIGMSVVFGAVSQVVHSQVVATIVMDIGAVLVTPFQNIGMVVLYLNLRGTNFGK